MKNGRTLHKISDTTCFLPFPDRLKDTRAVPAQTLHV